MSAEPATLQHDSRDQLIAALRRDFAGEPEPASAEPDVAQRLIETEARRQQLWDALIDAQGTVDNVSAVLHLLVLDGTIDSVDFPQHIAGSIRLCENVIGNLAKRLGEAL